MLIFDFDGVLINSLDEVALTSYNAATGKLYTSLADAPSDPIELFMRNRFHVQPIGDAIVLMNWCLDSYRIDPNKILTREEYQNIICDAATELIDRTNLIYEARRCFIEKDTKGWLALHHTYQPLWEELAGRNNCPFVILTNKNHDATMRLCRHFGLGIDADDIYSGDQGISKIENMQKIQARFVSESFAFIDDSINNLKELDIFFKRKKLNLSLLLANWGYTGGNDAVAAQQSGYKVVNQYDVISLLGMNP